MAFAKLVVWLQKTGISRVAAIAENAFFDGFHILATKLDCYIQYGTRMMMREIYPSIVLCKAWS